MLIMANCSIAVETFHKNVNSMSCPKSGIITVVRTIFDPIRSKNFMAIHPIVVKILLS